MTFFERYQAGEHEAVWAELIALGERVRDPAVLPDAEATARETMRRVKANVLRIEEGLRALGYRFGDLPNPSDRKISFMNRNDVTPDQQDFMQRMSATLLGGGGFASQTDVESGLKKAFGARVSPFAGLIGQMMLGVRDFQDKIRERVKESSALAASSHVPVEKLTCLQQQDIATFESRVGPIPLSLKAFWLEVGSVDFTGAMDGWGDGGEFVLDPLLVMPPLNLMELWKEWREDSDEDERFSLEISGDADAKGGYSGSPLEIFLPEAGADMVFEAGWSDNRDDDFLFVDYLRYSIRNAGFPGFDGVGRPLPKELKPLAEAWTPF